MIVSFVQEEKIMGSMDSCSVICMLYLANNHIAYFYDTRILVVCK